MIRWLEQAVLSAPERGVTFCAALGWWRLGHFVKFGQLFAMGQRLLYPINKGEMPHKLLESHKVAHRGCTLVTSEVRVSNNILFTLRHFNDNIFNFVNY